MAGATGDAAGAVVGRADDVVLIRATALSAEEAANAVACDQSGATTIFIGKHLSASLSLTRLISSPGALFAIFAPPYPPSPPPPHTKGNPTRLRQTPRMIRHQYRLSMPPHQPPCIPILPVRQGTLLHSLLLAAHSPGTFPPSLVPSQHLQASSTRVCGRSNTSNARQRALSLNAPPINF